MSRLIDADIITEKIMNVFEEALKTALKSGTYDLEGVMLKIKCYLDNQPTAYDVDKVVEQLEKLSTIHYSRFDDYMKQGNKELAYKHLRAFNAYHKAIEIVKAGGRDE